MCLGKSKHIVIINTPIAHGLKMKVRIIKPPSVSSVLYTKNHLQMTIGGIMLHANQNYNRAIKKAKGRSAASVRKKVTNIAQHSPNAFCKYVKQQSRKQDTHNVTLNESYYHFSNLATFDCNENTHQSACYQISVDDLDKTISHEVKKAIDNLGRGKSR